MTMPTLPVSAFARGPDRRRVPVRVRLAGDEDVAVGTMTITGEFRGRLHHEDDHLVLWAHTGTVHISGLDVHGLLGEGVPTILMAGVDYSVEASPARLSVIRISDTYLRQTIEEASGLPAGGVDPEQIRVALRCVVPALFEPSGTQDMGLRRQVVNAIVETVRAGTLGTVPSATTGKSERFARALAYISEHAREPIGLADVAAAANLTDRGLQQMFQREIGRTPTAVLRSTRLEGARAEIQDAQPDQLIGDIARSWQFWHLGRFASVYRQAYGENPSETRRHHDGHVKRAD